MRQMPIIAWRQARTCYHRQNSARRLPQNGEKRMANLGEKSINKSKRTIASAKKEAEARGCGVNIKREIVASRRRHSGALRHRRIGNAAARIISLYAAVYAAQHHRENMRKRGVALSCLYLMP